MESIIKEFLERVHTFSVDNWFSMTKGLSPYKVARLGFKCTGLFQVECVQCQSTECLQPGLLDNTPELEELFQQLEAFQTRLPMAHQEDCLYSHNPEQQKLLRIKKHYLIRHWQTHYQANLESFPKDNLMLPSLDPSFSTLMPSQVLKTFVKQDCYDTPQILAIFGWAYQKQEQESFLFCNFCGRTVCLSEFSLVSPQQSLGSSSADCFQVLLSHRWFCKWGRMDETGDKVYGWTICVNFLQEAVDQQQDKQLYFDRQKEARRIQDELTSTIETLKLTHSTFMQRFKEIKELAEQCPGEEGGLQDILDRRKEQLGESIRVMEQEVVKKVKL